MPRLRPVMGRLGLAAVMMLVGATGAHARSRPPLHDPVSLNIGLTCQWQQKCIKTQERAMKRALRYVKKERPPAWRIQLCNRNASRNRGRGRVDWIGYNNCIRNAALTPPPPVTKRTRRK